jgi:hypothetical protein
MEKPSAGNALTELLGGSQPPSASGPVPPTAPPPKAPIQTTSSTHAALNISQAVPSWKDQLDWDAPEEPEPEPKTEANLDGTESNTQAQQKQEATKSDTTPNSDDSEANRKQGINMGHALPSWRDQLDWESPEEPASAATETETAEPVKAVETVATAPDHDNSHEWPMDPMTESQEDAPVHDESRDDNDETSLPGDDWIDIDPTHQMETAAHLEPLTMDNLTLKPGRSAKKNRDKKKAKTQSQHSSSQTESVDEIVK